MDFMDSVENFQKVFMLVFGAFVIWSLARWTRVIMSTASTLRVWLGSLGLIAGICSAVLFAWFYIYLFVERALIAHGAALWLYYYAGGLLSLIGLGFGLAGRGWMRQSSVVISIVMIFQWLEEMTVGRKQEFFLVVGMFLSLAAVGIISLAHTVLIGRTNQS
jgi:hypothetical protein